MFNVLVVDDDVEILEYISNLAEWEKFDMSVICKATSGEEALEFATKNEINLLITDITMAEMSGLDLIRKCLNNNPLLKCIILTCHEDFSFAKEAIELQVSNYIVKYTITKEELEDALKDISISLNNNLMAMQEETKIKELNKRNAPLLCEKILDNIFMNNYVSIPTVIQTFDLLGVDVRNETRFAVIYIDDIDVIDAVERMGSKQTLLYAIQNIANELLEDQPFSKILIFNDLLITFFSEDTSNEYYLADTFKKLTIKIKNVLNVEFTVVITEKNRKLINFSADIKLINEFRHNKFYSDDPVVVFQSFCTKPQKVIEFSLKELTCAINNNNFDLLSTIVGKQLSDFEKQKSNYSTVNDYYSKIIILLNKCLCGKHAIKTKKIDTFTTFKKAIQKALSEFKTAMINESNQKKENKEILLAINYMKHNMSEHITCEKMAQLVHLNTSYFSCVFSEVNGISFSDYLTKIRIDHATFLLRNSDLTIDEITNEIGLSDRHYFYRLYKKQTGQVPGEVRKKINI